MLPILLKLGRDKNGKVDTRSVGGAGSTQSQISKTVILKIGYVFDQSLHGMKCKKKSRDRRGEIGEIVDEKRKRRKREESDAAE